MYLQEDAGLRLKIGRISLRYYPKEYTSLPAADSYLNCSQNYRHCVICLSCCHLLATTPSDRDLGPGEQTSDDESVADVDKAAEWNIEFVAGLKIAHYQSC